METPPLTVKKTLGNTLAKNSLTPCRRVGLCRPSSGSAGKMFHVRTLSTPEHHNSPQVKSQSCVAAAFPICAPSSCSKVPLKFSNGQNKGLPRVRRCLTKEPNVSVMQNVKRTFSESEIENCATTEKEPDEHSVEELKSYQYKKVKSGGGDKCQEVKPAGGGKYQEACDTVILDIHETHSCKTFRDEDLAITEDSIAQLVSSLLEKNKKLQQFKVQHTYSKKHNLEELRAHTAKWRSAGQDALRHCVALARQAGYSVTIHQLMTLHGFPPDLMGYNTEEDEFE